AINDSVASYHANLGMALIGLELPSEALESLEKAIGLAPDNPKYRQLRALATEMKQNNIRFWQ
ncbi:MAG TPA: tetratricopeptide repeat protein, partial [Candidatus Saccharimonadales bacterium]|nr:tetratricopeptide repeat protein [Candidatus Saccharimonadales bacterium]